MKIYTKTGDEGTTGLLSNRRVFKDDIRIACYGTVDELNAVLGVARAGGIDRNADEVVARLQEELFVLGSALADPSPDGPFHHSIQESHVSRLEQVIDGLETEVPPLSTFILPGGSPPAAALHLARTVCRRAERLVVSMARDSENHVPAALVVYLNRLSDLLFVLARVVNHRAGVADIPWKGL